MITNTIDSTDYCYFPISNQEVHLSIQASHDARISLRTHLGEDSKVYEISLGERENTMSSIKVNNIEPSVSLVETRDILSEDEERSFWIRWKWYNGLLSVGHEGCEAFIAYRDKDPFIINYIGISTAYGATGSWVLDGIQTQCLEIRQQLLDTNHYWINYNDNLGMPRNAVTVSECGSFVGRAPHEGSVTPGNVEGDICTLPWGGCVHNKSHFQVLCGKNINWVKSWDGSVPLHALPGGETEDNYPLFIGRVFIDGMYYAGKIQPNHQVCYIPHCGIEKSFKEYETLVVNCHPNIEWVGR